MKQNLTDLAIQALKPADRQYERYDTQVRNFGIRVSPAGTKTFFALTGPAERRSRVSLGRYPMMNLKAARRAAQRLDPDSGYTPTFAEAREAYLAQAAKNLRPRSLIDVQRHLNGSWKAIKHHDLKDITSVLIKPPAQLS